MKSDEVEIAAHFEKKSQNNTDDLITIKFTRDHSWLDAMQMMQDFQESGGLQEKGKRIDWCIWPNAPIIEEVAALMIETLEDASHYDSYTNNVHWEQFVFQDFDQSNEHHCRILSTVCRLELFQYLWIGGRNDQLMSTQTAMDISHAISKNSSIEEISVFLKLMNECFPILGNGLENAKNQKKLSLHLNLSDTMYSGNSPLAIEFQNGIAQSKYLRQLDLDGFPIKWLYSLFQALENSPIQILGLKKCQWETEDTVENETVLSPLWNQVARYLSYKECPLKTLDLSYPSSSLNVSTFVSCLERNASLQTMRLRHGGLVSSDLVELLAAAAATTTTTNNARCFPMRELNLRGNSISLLDLSNLVLKNKHTQKDTVEDPLTTQLSRLNLDGNRNNHIWPEDDAKQIQKVLLWLLNRYPSLSFLGDRFARSYLCDPLVQHAMDLNRLGTRRWRRTIGTIPTDPSAAAATTTTSFPMALWPYMLERPTRILSKDPARQASVVFRLLVDGVGMMLVLHETG